MYPCPTAPCRPRDTLRVVSRRSSHRHSNRCAHSEYPQGLPMAGGRYDMTDLGPRRGNSHRGEPSPARGPARRWDTLLRSKLRRQSGFGRESLSALSRPFSRVPLAVPFCVRRLQVKYYGMSFENPKTYLHIRYYRVYTPETIEFRETSDDVD